MSSRHEQFRNNGYLVVRNAIDQGQLSRYTDSLHQVDTDKKKDTWTYPDGVCQESDFWSVIFLNKVTDAVREALGDDIRFVQHNDLHYGYSSFSWHRDSLNRLYKKDLPDWQEDEETYQVARVGFYLQPRHSNFHFGVVPGSHRLGGVASESDFYKMDKHLTKREIAKIKLGMKDYLKEKAIWIDAAEGDCVVFDPRLIHTGGKFTEKKFSFFTAYGIDNVHTQRHYTYYRHLRSDLGYKPLRPEFISMLQEENLYLPEKKYIEEIEGAWIPSDSYAFVTRVIEGQK